MRPLYKQYPILFTIAVVLTSVFMIQMLCVFRSTLSVKHIALPKADSVKKSQSCEPCSSYPEGFDDLDPELDVPESENVVPVKVSDIMSGKPIILPQDDKAILDYIWSNDYMEKPTGNEYNLTNPNVDPSMGQGQFIRKLLKSMTKGFFVECGGLDGETRSNTLFLEKNLNWNGLLVEADPSNYALLKSKNRKAWMSNTCLAINPYPHVATFSQSFNIGKIESNDIDQSKLPSGKAKNLVQVQCMPIFSLLSALNVTTVDYFSLDVEGAELQVLKTIPFDKVKIRTLSVEFNHIADGKDELVKFMEGQGYQKVGEVLRGGWANDVMFALKSMKIGV